MKKKLSSPSPRFLLTLRVLPALAIGAACFTQPAMAGDTNVGVSVNVSQPGFYGRVDIGNQPPAVIYQQPVIIQQTPVAIHQRPIYMHVPPGHYKNWARYCGQYRACGQPVYFVRDDDRGRYDRRDDDHDDNDHGHGRGHGKGHGHGHGRGRD